MAAIDDHMPLIKIHMQVIQGEFFSSMLNNINGSSIFRSIHK